jgi:hypothetical protein
VSSGGWTLEQAAELVLEHLLEFLDGCDDDDRVRSALAIEAVRRAWAPDIEVEPFDCTAGELRERIAAGRSTLARASFRRPAAGLP